MKNLRINVTLDQTILDSLTVIASKTHTKIASLARNLIIESLDRYEDIALSELADKCDSGEEKLISHKDAWK